MALFRLGFTDIRQEEPFAAFSVDWYCPSLHLGFEADGGQHRLPNNKRHDIQRDAQLLADFGLPIIRLNTTDVRRLARTTGAR